MTSSLGKIDLNAVLGVGGILDGGRKGRIASALGNLDSFWGLLQSGESVVE